MAQKKSIIIERPEGLIPGLRDVNEMLRKLCGYIFVVKADDASGVDLTWEDCYLSPESGDIPQVVFRTPRKVWEFHDALDLGGVGDGNRPYIPLTGSMDEPMRKDMSLVLDGSFTLDQLETIVREWRKSL